MNKYWLVVCFCLLFSLGWLISSWRSSAEISKLKSDYAIAIAASERARADGFAEAKSKYESNAKSLSEIANHAQTQLVQARTDAANARAAVDRLLNRASSTAAANFVDNSTITDERSSAGIDCRVYADLLERLGELAQQYATIADERGIAGKSCENAYDKVSN